MSSESPKNDYLSDRLEDQIKWHSAKARENKKKFHWLQIIIIVSGALIPLFSAFGVSESLQNYTGLVTAILGVTIVIVTAFIQMFKYQENWILYRNTSELLKKEKYFYLNDVGIYSTFDSQEKKRMLVERVETFVSAETSKYFTIHKPEKPEPQPVSNN
jgi:hypothetical protein